MTAITARTPLQPPTFSLKTSENNKEALNYAFDGLNGFELWRSDGTKEGTSMVADLYENAADGDDGEW